MTVRCLLCYAAWFGLEVSTSDVRVAFMHAVASEPKFFPSRMAVVHEESKERNEDSVEKISETWSQT